MKRAQEAAICRDLDKKMVIVVGPRQAGKTWLAQHIANQISGSIYLNYDSLSDRSIILQEAWLPNVPLIVFDELHKMPAWKNYLKGVYDTKHPRQKILVTGSARMDSFSNMGDSLAGRYFKHHLLPLSPAELSQTQHNIDLDFLMQRSGFPEPFLADNDIDAERWRMQYVNSLLSTDVFEFADIQSIKTMRMIFELLRRRVGSPISYQSIAEDVSTSPNTVKKYIHILESLYVVFRVTPFSKSIARSIKKEPKLYFFDLALVLGDNGAKTENLAALSLFKHVLALNDYQAKPYQLHYLRTKEKLEIDFALACDDTLETLIEIKYANTTISKTLQKFSEKYNVEAIQLVRHLRHERRIDGISVLRLEDYLIQLYL